MTKIAFQDQLLNNNCWGCGSNNEDGLQIKSYWAEDLEGVALMNWKPAHYHKAGPDHVLNGGIISTIIDCHSICTAIAHVAKIEEVPISDDLWHVTGTLHVKYLKPTPIDQQVELHAKIIEMEGKKSIVSCSLYSNGIETAQGKTIAFRVPVEWLNRSSH